MKYVPNAVSLKVGRQLLRTQKISPSILFGVGIVGVVGSTVLACRATLKVEDILDKAHEDIEKLKNDRVIITKIASDLTYRKELSGIYIRTTGELGRLYGPALLVGTTAI